ncbi:CDP-glycerol glycerophosphotransferase family protein [Pseudomonas guariconensis]|uniref:CDP-glycerol glycerophosphotransferase family protein n=1 Tax=Pseudomonas guariconensis TaxID=1288410 RepID=UPI002B05C120|nr:CDP-glycerol glycerophosphotransferase family protein [Pseudomonas guariconensis]
MLRKLLEKFLRKDPLRLKVIAYHLAGLIPRRSDLWVFGAHGGRLFSCNSKYFYLDARKRLQGAVRCVWISRDPLLVQSMTARGLDAAYLFSWRGMWSCLRASGYFINVGLRDISFTLSKGVEVINLWHGIPLKKIEMDDERRSKKQARRTLQRSGGSWGAFFNPKKYAEYSYILASSEYVADYAMKSAFGLPASRCLPFGFPRTDLFFYSRVQLLEHIQAYEASDVNSMANSLQKFQKTFIYMPTFRDDGKNFVQAAGIDFEDLDRRLGEQGYGLFLKFHPSTRLDTKALASLCNITVLDKDLDVYPLLPLIDVLITDYSSIYFDFLLLNRPIVFFPFDLPAYQRDCRSLYLDYESHTPGIKVMDYSALRDALFDRHDDWASGRAEMRRLFWGTYSGDASLRLGQWFAAQVRAEALS